ncbi:DUF3310 domain-containing protein [Dyadobacter fermentans]|uniref:DUF3310 domain-containing protein n=1 Tax=Dyadobacter fermentans TaxID=94254 RepID=UPI001CBCC9CE|nr:DUF3310 domain-containing protein [Dyadobacter fermentans]MBZ1361983.1 DUF3310 domain-containing protein [Dyadobacter fermentans]
MNNSSNFTVGGFANDTFNGGSELGMIVEISATGGVVLENEQKERWQTHLNHLRSIMPDKSQVDHPAHYGGKDDPYEAIKVIEAWKLDFPLGNTVKYISRAGKKDATKLLEDLEKAKWYLQRKIDQLTKTIAH